MKTTLKSQLSDIPKAAMNSLPASIAMLDASGIIVWANQSWHSFAADDGWHQDDALAVGASYVTFFQRSAGVWVDHNGEIREGISSVLRGERQEFRYEVVRQRHGEDRWYQLSATSLQPHRSGVILAQLDITSQKQAERLAHDAARRSAVIAAASSAFAQLAGDLQPLLDAVTRAAADAFDAACVLRLVNDEADRLEPVSMHHPNPQHKRVFNDALISTPVRLDEAYPGQVFQTGRSVNAAQIPDACWSPTAQHYPALQHAYARGTTLIVPVRGGGRVLGTLGVLRSDPIPFSDADQDLLEELGRRAGLAVDSTRLYCEALLSQEQLQAVIEHVPAIVYSASMDDTISTIYINPQVTDMLGYPPQAFLDDDQFWTNHLHPDDRARVVAAMDELPHGVPLDEEYRMIAADGRTVWLRDRAGFIRGDDGRPALIQGVAIDITDRKRFELNQARQLRRAFHDPLTDLPNRSLFVDRVAHALSIAARSGTTLSILHMEIDRFKTINDSLGREAGDQLLRAIATRLSECVRPGDTLARLGGDEFGMLLEQCGEADVITLAQRIDAALAIGFQLAGRETFVSTSIGIAVGDPERDSPVDLLHNADVALHEAKERGGARIETFNPSMRTRVLQRLEMETELRQAIDRNQLRLHYQPKIELTTGEIVAFEALIRWEHPVRGLVGPDTFIPQAEENGLIMQIGDWVMWEACRQARVWNDTVSGFEGITVDLNLSARQFQPGLLGEIRRVLRDTRISADRIGLEITESAVMDDADQTIDILRRLKELGVRLAIDDFGTGYSSLAYLKRFPVDVLKIDRLFIAGLAEEENQAIVSSVIHLAHALKMRVIAEGIEEAPQADQLRQMCCDMGQGYYVARPMPPASVPAWIQTRQ